MINTRKTRDGHEVRIGDPKRGGFCLAVGSNLWSALMQSQNELECHLALVNKHIMRERAKKSTERMVGND